MDNTDLKAISNLLHACRTFKSFADDALAAAAERKPLAVTGKQRSDLITVSLLVQAASKRFEPAFFESFEKTHKGPKSSPFPSL